MTPDQHALIMVRGSIASLPPEDQQKVAAAEKDFRELMKKHGEHAGFAVALIGAELAAE